MVILHKVISYFTPESKEKSKKEVYLFIFALLSWQFDTQILITVMQKSL